MVNILLLLLSLNPYFFSRTIWRQITDIMTFQSKYYIRYWLRIRTFFFISTIPYHQTWTLNTDIILSIIYSIFKFPQLSPKWPVRLFIFPIQAWQYIWLLFLFHFLSSRIVSLPIIFFITLTFSKSSDQLSYRVPQTGFVCLFIITWSKLNIFSKDYIGNSEQILKLSPSVYFICFISICWANTGLDCTKSHELFTFNKSNSDHGKCTSPWPAYRACLSVTQSRDPSYQVVPSSNNKDSRNRFIDSLVRIT